MRRRKVDPNRTIIMGIVTLVVATAIAYTPALKSGYIWDDWGVHDNLLILTSDGLWKIWFEPSSNADETHYWPLVYTFFWIEHRVWGDRPFFFHLMNLLFHIANTLLIWALFRKLYLQGAWFGAALFALHPVHVESVAWIIERKDVLSAFFYLLAFLIFIRFITERKYAFYALSILLFIMAMLSKSVAISLPVVLGLYLWWKRKPFRPKELLYLMPYLLIVLIIVPLDLLLVRQKELVTFGFTFIERILLASRSFAFYSTTLLIPHPLMPFYPKWNINAANIGLYIILLLELAIFVMFWIKRKKWGKGPLVAAAFYAVTLTPMLGFIDYNFFCHAYVADRFQYLASIGPLGLCAVCLTLILNRIGSEKEFHAAVGAILLIVFGILTFNQSTFYKDEETLYLAAIQRNPAAGSAHYNLGALYNRTDRPEMALKQYEKALKYKAEWMEIHSNIGWAYEKLGNNEKAMEYYREALRLHPDKAKSHFRYASLLLKQGKYDEAIRHFEITIEYDPIFTEAYSNMGVCYSQKGDNATAITSFQKAIEINPLHIPAYGNLGVAFIKTGCFEEAEKTLLLALEINPWYSEAHYSLAHLRCEQQRYEESLYHFQKVLSQQPDNPDARFNLGITLYHLGRFNEAITQLKETLRIDPTNEEAKYNLEGIQAMLKKQQH